MESMFARNKVSLLLIGILLVVLGIFIFANPGATTLFISQVVAWAVLIGGALFAVLNALSLKQEGNAMVGVIIGALVAVLGFFLVRHPGLLVSYLFVFLGLVVALKGVGDLFRANELRKAGSNQWQIGMIIGVLCIIAGVAVLGAPFAAANFVTTIAAIALIFSGGSQIVTAFWM